MKPVIFAGPTIHGIDRTEIAGFDVRAPAGCGDILVAVAGGARAIGLIDGVFEHVPAVWHKEILHALASGVVVVGAASMGALRAVECAAFGMIGIGSIFEAYRRGDRVADGDVAVVHGPAELDYCPLTEALVNVEATLARVRGRDLISAAECSGLLHFARQVHFKDRTHERLAALAPLAPERRPIVAELMKRNAVDVKRADAHQLLHALRDGIVHGPVPAIASEELNRSVFFDQLQRRVAVGRTVAQ